jgi:hypothetical protein
MQKKPTSWRGKWAQFTGICTEQTDKIIQVLKLLLGKENVEDTQNLTILSSLFCATTTTTTKTTTATTTPICPIEPDKFLAVLVNPRFKLLRSPRIQQLLFLLREERGITYLHPFVQDTYRPDKRWRQNFHDDIDYLKSLYLVRVAEAVKLENHDLRGKPPDVFLFFNATERDRRSASLRHWEIRRSQQQDQGWSRDEIPPPPKEPDESLLRQAPLNSEDQAHIRLVEAYIAEGRERDIDPKALKYYDKLKNKMKNHDEKLLKCLFERKFSGIRVITVVSPSSYFLCVRETEFNSVIKELCDSK